MARELLSLDSRHSEGGPFGSCEPRVPASAVRGDDAYVSRYGLIPEISGRA
jgi:hypothetical protein